MKKIFLFITMFLIIVSMQLQSKEKTKKILVVYFSRVGISSFSKDVDTVTSASLRVGDKGFIGKYRSDCRHGEECRSR